MRWKQFFTPVESVDSGQAREMMAKTGTGDMTILDVRQPSEYSAGHIPGATLIPLPQLGDRLAELARIQNEHGRDSIASYWGRSTAHNLGALLAVAPVQKIIGSRNIYTGSTVDQMPHNFVWHFMLGHQFLCTVPDINRTDYYLMLGTNPKISNGAQMSTGANTWKKLNAIRERGGKCVLIDPRRNESAKYMDEHHFIKPGTDALFLIGLIVLGPERLPRVANQLGSWLGQARRSLGNGLRSLSYRWGRSCTCSDSSASRTLRTRRALERIAT